MRTGSPQQDLSRQSAPRGPGYACVCTCRLALDSWAAVDCPIGPIPAPRWTPWSCRLLSNTKRLL
eukprot:6954793-Ditylum_brightwellii.AAC.1